MRTCTYMTGTPRHKCYEPATRNVQIRVKGQQITKWLCEEHYRRYVKALEDSHVVEHCAVKVEL